MAATRNPNWIENSVLLDPRVKHSKLWTQNQQGAWESGAGRHAMSVVGTVAELCEESEGERNTYLTPISTITRDKLRRQAMGF